MTFSILSEEWGCYNMRYQYQHLYTSDMATTWPARIKPCRPTTMYIRKPIPQSTPSHLSSRYCHNNKNKVKFHTTNTPPCFSLQGLHNINSFMKCNVLWSQDVLSCHWWSFQYFTYILFHFIECKIKKKKIVKNCWIIKIIIKE